jgi:hypothetical protein
MWNVGRQERAYRFLWGSLRERDPLEDISIDASITLKWIFKKQFGETWTDLIWVRRGAVGRHL